MMGLAAFLSVWAVSAVTAGRVAAETSEPVVSTAEAPADVQEENMRADGEDEEILERIRTMTLEEKIGQLFIVTPEALTGSGGVTYAGETLAEEIRLCAPGGFIFNEWNLSDPDQTKTLLGDMIRIYEEAGLPGPFLALDEEGGCVTRIAKNSAFEAPQFPDMREIGAGGNPDDAALAGSVIGGYLSLLGFNMDFAPVADVLTNPDNTVVARRSFGSDPVLVSEMVRAMSGQLLSNGIIPVLKHFPGHGATAGDTHNGYAAADRTYEELLRSELVPFADGTAYAPAMMAAHISLPEVTGDDLPASLSKTLITGVLREKLGYGELVITDAMNMGAVVSQYSSAEAAVMAVEAGCDIILMPADFRAAREGLLEAAASGRITEERIDESLYRILSVKKRFLQK